MDRLDPACQARSSLSMSGFIYILEECGSVDAIFQDFAKASKKVSHLHLLLKLLRRAWRTLNVEYFLPQKTISSVCVLKLKEQACNKSTKHMRITDSGHSK